MILKKDTTSAPALIQKKRLEKHNAGATKSTRPYRPWITVYFEEFITK
ncbi:MAG: hypothetical protein JW894_03650 [Bacteroidales bacterium]|nr:hypothetical protein [Bacteroidales bacterium]